VASLRPSNPELMVDPGTKNNLYWGKTVKRKAHTPRDFFFDGPSVFYFMKTTYSRCQKMCTISSDVSFFFEHFMNILPFQTGRMVEYGFDI
jgi:hypothetical protein